MPTIWNYMNPCLDFHALENFKNLSFEKKLCIGVITTLFMTTLIFAIPIFRYLVGQCAEASIPTHIAPRSVVFLGALDKTENLVTPQVKLSQNFDILVDGVSLANRKQISKELADYELVGIINVEEKQYEITHSKSEYPILSTHNLLTCFSIVCYDEINRIASLSHYQSLPNMEFSLRNYQKDLQEMYSVTGSVISNGRFRISIVCGMAGFEKNRLQDLSIAQKKVIKLLQAMGAKVISVNTDIHNNIPKSVAVDTRTGIVFSHVPVTQQMLCTNTTWQPTQKEAAFFTQSRAMHARLEPWIKDGVNYPAAVRAKTELQGMKNSEDHMSVQLSDFIPNVIEKLAFDKEAAQICTVE